MENEIKQLENKLKEATFKQLRKEICQVLIDIGVHKFLKFLQESEPEFPMQFRHKKYNYVHKTVRDRNILIYPPSSNEQGIISLERNLWKPFLEKYKCINGYDVEDQYKKCFGKLGYKGYKVWMTGARLW